MIYDFEEFVNEGTGFMSIRAQKNLEEYDELKKKYPKLMTAADMKKLVPGQSIIKFRGDGGDETEYIFKKLDGGPKKGLHHTWIIATDDFSNPVSNHEVAGDHYMPADRCEIVRF